MTEAPLTHDRCSELLRDYVHGELSARSAAAVEEHVSSCDDCARELRAVRALLVPVSDTLSELERRRLRAAVEAEAPPAGSSSAEVYPARASIARWLGVAAMVALIAIGVASLGSGVFEGADQETVGDDAAGGSLRDSADEEGSAVQPESAEGTDSGDSEAPPTPLFDGRDAPLDQGDLVKRARRGEPFVTFSRAYSADDAEALQDEYLELLVTQAREQDAALVRTCAEQVIDSQGFPLLPTYAAIGPRDGRDVLVLGFTWTADAGGPLDRFQLWTWPLGQCDAPPEYSAGRIRR